MRNAVIRKKRLKADRMVRDYMWMPQRFIAPAFNSDPAQWTQTFATNRLGFFAHTEDAS